MKTLGLSLCLTLIALPACSSHGKMLPQTPQSSVRQGKVAVSFVVPAPAAQSSSTLRRPQYFSPGTTALAIALKSENGAAPDSTAWNTNFQLAKICTQSGAYYYCSTTVTVPAGDDVLGALAYSTTPTGTLSGNIPLSFGEGEIVIGSGSSAEPAGAEDPTGRLYITLSPVIYGGQVDEGANPQANTIPIALSEFVDPSLNVIPGSAFDNALPQFANTPYLSDSDTSGMTYLKDVTTGLSGASVALSSPSDQVQLQNTRKESSGTHVTATLTYHAAQPDATFTIPSYFQIPGSVSASYTVPPAGSSSDLTFTCTSSSCIKGNS
jgi:hypothetical protein